MQCVVMVGSLTLPDFGFAPIFFGADAPPTPEQLAFTGPSDVQIFALIAFALIAVGGLLVFVIPRTLDRRRV
ncbi:MAG: hypothetical protein ACC652_04315 [Acidimicrobiales bacterium]